MNIPSIVKFLIVPISLLESRTNALDAAAVPAVTPFKTPISAVVIVVLSSVKEVSPVIVPVTAKSPVISTPVLLTLNLSVLFTKVFTSLLVPKLIYS